MGIMMVSEAFRKMLTDADFPSGLLSNARGIFGTNFGRLRELKLRYDPDNVFDKAHSLVSISS